MVSFRVLDSNRVKGRINTGAHYVVAYAEHGLESYTNVGFMLQQMDLWLSSRGIGSWWHGLIRPVSEFEEVDGLPFAFMLTFGIADGEVHRKDKQLTVEITDAAKEYIIDSAYDPIYGARPLKRFIQSKIETLLARKIIGGDIEPESTLWVDFNGSSLIIQ